MKITFKRVIYTLFSISLILLLIYISSRYTSKEISEYVLKFGIFAPLLYISIQILGQIFAPLSTSALFVAGFLMFEKEAIYYSIITWVVSSVINFYLSRTYGKKIIAKLIGQEAVDRIENIADRIDNNTFFVLRVCTFYINDFTSYAYGLTKISFKRFFISTIVSMIPWAIITALIMERGDSAIYTTFKIFLSMIPFALISYIYLKRKK